MAFIGDALVSYRAHSGNLANRMAMGHGESDEVALIGLLEAELTKLEGFREVRDSCADGVRIDFDGIARRERAIAEMLSWRHLGTIQRMGSCFAEALRGNPALTRWKLLRVIGRFPRYQPRIAIGSLRRGRG